MILKQKKKFKLRILCAALALLVALAQAPCALATPDDTLPSHTPKPSATAIPRASSLPSHTPKATASAAPAVTSASLPSAKTVNGTSKVERADMLSASGEDPAQPSEHIGADTVISVGDSRIYDFKSEGYGGVGLNGDIMPFQLYYGLYAKAEGGKLSYKSYNYSEGVTPLTAAILRRNSTGAAVRLPDISSSHTKTVDLSELPNDSYNIAMMFSNQNICHIPLYINDGRVYIVRSVEATEDRVRSDFLYHSQKLSELAAKFGVTPQNSLTLDEDAIVYPYPAARAGWRCDNDRWRALARSIVPDNTLPDSLKVAMIHDWMTQNLAYDYFVSREIGMDRSVYYRDFSGKYSVYDTKAGVCRDFVNIFALMCRELGVPASSIENHDINHTWSIVWIDGRWEELDVTNDLRRFVHGADTTDVKTSGHAVNYRDFLTPGCYRAGGLGGVQAVGEDIYCSSFTVNGVHKGCPHEGYIK